MENIAAIKTAKVIIPKIVFKAKAALIVNGETAINKTNPIVKTAAEIIRPLASLRFFVRTANPDNARKDISISSNIISPQLSKEI